MTRALLNRLSGGAGHEYHAVWFAFNAPLGLPAATLLLTVVFCVGALFWWSRLRGSNGKGRWVLLALRAGGPALVLFMLLDPMLVGRRNQPGDHFVLVLLDDSQSMTVPGGDGRTRAERLLGAWEASGFETALRESHQVVLFRFGKRLERLRDVTELRFEQRETDLLGAVRSALSKVSGATVSAVVLISDGVQQSPQPADLQDALPAGVPVFTVGAGLHTGLRSLELAGISVSRTDFDRSPVALTAHVASEGLAGEGAVVEVTAGARVVASTAFTISDDRAENSVRLEFVPRGDGWRHYRARVRLAETGPAALGPAVEQIAHPEKDPVAENNLRDFVVDNRHRTYRILYFSGRPNWEQKFVRRALESAPQLELSSLIRISGPERKFVFRGRDASLSNPLFEGFDDGALNAPRYDEAVFLRIGVGASELVSGYPAGPEELYRYHLVIWADIERGFFSKGQMERTRDFVSKRGGSLLVLGGPNAFAEGDYTGSIIEPMLPVMLGRAGRNGADPKRPFSPRPTVEGVLSGIWSLDPDPRKNGAIWEGLPELYGANRFAMARAGATVLARVEGAAGDLDGRPLFAWQRYGEGTCAALATGETWQWQMLTENGDAAHGRFWRQMLRALVKGAPQPVVLADGGEDVTAGETRQLKFRVRDSLFTAREGLVAEVRVTDPAGTELSLPVEESIAEAGIYAAEFVPERAGMHLMNLSARDANGQAVGELEQAVLVHPDTREFQSSRYNPSFLKQIAAHTGGEFTPLEGLDRLASKIPWTDSRNERLDRFHLWHFPPLYFAVVLLVSIEWVLRRKRGHP